MPVPLVEEQPAVTTTVLPKEAEPGDHDTFSHYVTKDQILNSQVTGEPCVALCGKIWVPVKNPENFPVCPECKDIYDNVVGTGNTSGPDHSGGEG